jgi:minor extracellular serine protease Vpr
MNRLSLALLLAFAAFSQTRSRLAEYAVILQDEPVARKIQPRVALSTPLAQTQFQTIRKAQSAVTAELRRRKLKVTGANQFLVNAVFVMATPDDVAALRAIPGVAWVTPAPRLHLDLDRAINVANVPAAWSALGGAANAGANVKIGIIDSGIDINHPGFQGTSLTLPPGFPKGDPNYTNNKVIVARSYIALSAVGYYADPSNIAATSRPDDTSPRDHVGHGTAIAMIAAGVQNSGPAATIQGVAPGAFLGNYKVVGSPSVLDYPLFSAVIQALEDAVTDGMDVVTMSMSESDTAYYGPLDVDTSPNGCGGQCDTLSVAVENAVAAGTVVVVPAGNDGASGFLPRTLMSIESPGVAPSAITVGATMNAHQEFQQLRIDGGYSFKALFGDGPKPSGPVSGQLLDLEQWAGDPFACSPLPSNKFPVNAPWIAFIQRGNCFFSEKINNAQNAGASAVVIYQSSGDTIYSSLGAQNTGIPAMMIGNTDGLAVKNLIDHTTQFVPTLTATLDPAFNPADTAFNTMWPSSSRGPSPGTFGITPTTTGTYSGIKPEIVAPGADIYTATQKLDPSGDAYNASGYTAVTGTSFSVPFVAGAVALVKQKNPTFTPAQLKSAVVNTGKDVTDGGVTASVNAMGAGQLSAGDAINASATIEPATISFGAITSTTVSISRDLKITNTGSTTATFNLTLSHSDSMVQIVSSPVTVGAGGFAHVTVRLSGNRPAAGNYEGFVLVSNGSQTLRVPYQYLVGSNVPADTFVVSNGFFVAGLQDTGWPAFLRVIDQYGVPAQNTSLLFTKDQGDATITVGDTAPDRLGDAGINFNIGSTPGEILFTGHVASFSVPFDGYSRAYPAISANGVVNAASGQIGQGLAPGSYVAIYGTALSDALQLESTASLPISLSQVSVSFDGGGLSLPGHIHFVSTGQVNVQIPWEFQGQSSVTMKVTMGGLQSDVYTLPLAPTSPGIFEIAGVAAAEDANYAVIGPSHPAVRGQNIAIFVNGLGPVSNTPVSGDPSSGTTLSQTPVLPTVTIGGTNATVLFSGLTPSVVGLYQINLTVPPSIAAGNQQLVVTIGGVSSKASVLPVQ